MKNESFLISNQILKERYIRLVNAYNDMDKAFELYKSRVVEEGGEELGCMSLRDPSTGETVNSEE